MNTYGNGPYPRRVVTAHLIILFVCLSPSIMSADTFNVEIGQLVMEDLLTGRNNTDSMLDFTYDDGTSNVKGVTVTTKSCDTFDVLKSLRLLLVGVPDILITYTHCSLKQFLLVQLENQGYFRETNVRLKNSHVDVCCIMFRKQDTSLMIPPPSTNISQSFVHYTPLADPSVVVNDVLGVLGWKKACLLYTEEYQTQVNMVTKALSEFGPKFWIHTLRTPVDTESLISVMGTCYHIMMDTGVNFFILTPQTTVETILYEINALSSKPGELAKMGMVSRWLIWSEDVCAKCLESKIHNVSNVSILRRRNHGLGDSTTNPQNSSMVSDFTSDMYDLEEDSLLDTSISSNYEAIETVVTHIRSKLTEQFYPETQNEGYEVVTAFWQRAGRQFGSVASWGPSFELSKWADIFPNVGLGLNNITLLVTTKDWAPFTIRKVVDGKVQYEGICVDIMEEMSRRLNFSFIMFEPPDEEWGRKLPNGKWTGMIGQLVYRKADAMIAAASVQQEREEVMDFIHPFYNDYTSLLLKKPDQTLQKWKVLISPFQWTVVLGILLSLPFVTIVLSNIEKIHPIYNNVNRKGHRGLHRFDDCLWYNLAALLNEGGSETPKDQAGRTVVAAWWLATMVIVASYTSTLIAALTVEKSELPFNTIEEMVSQDVYRWGGTNGSYMFMLFEKSDNVVYRQIWDGMKQFEVEDPDVFNKKHDIQMDKLREGNYAYLNDKSKNLIEAAVDCDLAIAKQEFLPLNFAIGLQQNSPYRNLFSQQMMAIEEIGILELWKTKWWPPMHKCTNSGNSEVKGISIVDVQGGYFVLGFGTIVAILTWISEHMIVLLSRRCKCRICKTKA